MPATPHDRINTAKAEIADAKSDALDIEHDASDARVAAPGFPALLEDGTEVNIVAKHQPDPQQRTRLEDEDGVQYIRNRTTGRLEEHTLTEAEDDADHPNEYATLAFGSGTSKLTFTAVADGSDGEDVSVEMIRAQEYATSTIGAGNAALTFTSVLANSEAVSVSITQQSGTNALAVTQVGDVLEIKLGSSGGTPVAATANQVKTAYDLVSGAVAKATLAVGGTGASNVATDAGGALALTGVALAVTNPSGSLIRITLPTDADGAAVAKTAAQVKTAYDLVSAATDLATVALTDGGGGNVTTHSEANLSLATE